MTTDVIKYREAEKKLAAKAGAGFFSRQYREMPLGNRAAGEAAQTDGTWPQAQAHALRKMLERNRLDKEGWQRCMSATVALLKYAHTMLDRADAIIAQQAGRISFLEDMAMTDELTGLKNRRGFYDAFARELNKCSRGIAKGGLLVLIDLDNFKSVNDTHGHLAGDACLRLVARALETETRVMDVACRLGGDEFVLLLSNTTKGEAATRAQDLAWQLNNLSLAWYGQEIPVRASLGLRAYKAGDAIDRIFSDADAKLYAGKRARQQNKEAHPA